MNAESHSATLPADELVLPPAACSCRWHAARSWLFGVVGWLIAASAAVAVAFVPFDVGEELCGVWGCLPPVKALISLHLLIGVVMGAGVWALVHGRVAFLPILGRVIIVVSLLVGLVVVGADLMTWWKQMPPDLRHHWPRRIAYTLAVRTDWPIAEAVLAGIACIVVGRSRFTGVRQSR